MKGRKLIFMALPALAAGVALIMTYKSITNLGVIIAGGVLFVLAGVANVMALTSSRDKKGKSGIGYFGLAFGWISGAAAVVLGLSMLIFQSTFVGLLPFIFGVIVVFCALFQFFVLSVGIRPLLLAVWFYIFPLMLVGIAVYIFKRQQPDDEHVTMLATGIAFCVFGAAMVLEGIVVGSANRSLLREAETGAAGDAAVKEVTGLPESETDEDRAE